MAKLEMKSRKSATKAVCNIALCGHGHSGKSTLADTNVATHGAINRAASVDDGTSICDFDQIEKEHLTASNRTRHLDIRAGGSSSSIPRAIQTSSAKRSPRCTPSKQQ